MQRCAQKLSRFAIGVGMRDIEGSKIAARKAVAMAHDDTVIIAFHVPTTIPQQLLSSISEPGIEAFAESGNLFNVDFWKRTSTEAGNQLLEGIKEAAEAEMKKLGKSVKMSLEITSASGNVKSEMISFCRQNSIDCLFMGPGGDCKGRLPEFLSQYAYGFSVCVVRDHCRRK
eukprot:GEMP01073193.1.p1 GENE.GEMP01073193.1~~GEMP01073193.1.p1  ORF type:complete len:172 (+),score=31.60 GEMP01073193.1:59-574(+)